MPSVDAKSEANEALSNSDLSVTAAQLYRLYLNLKGTDNLTASVVYRSCAFEINFDKGSVRQQFVKTGGVSSIVKSDTANEFAEQLKQAHTLAAMTVVLAAIKTINDKQLQSELTTITKKNPDITADQVLVKLGTNNSSSLTSFGAFSRTAISPALAEVKKMLSQVMNNLKTLTDADKVCNSMQGLQQIAHPELKR